jgi:hypothetical protein
MRLRMACALFGLIFLVLGISGYMTVFISNGLLFGLLEVDEIHNLAHLLTGAIALLATATARSSKLCLKFIGFIYLVLGVAGFAMDGEVLGMQVNVMDNWLHLILGAAALYVGLSFKIPFGE